MGRHITDSVFPFQGWVGSNRAIHACFKLWGPLAAAAFLNNGKAGAFIVTASFCGHENTIVTFSNCCTNHNYSSCCLNLCNIDKLMLIYFLFHLFSMKLNLTLISQHQIVVNVWLLSKLITVQNKFKFCVLDSHNPINQGRCLKIKNQVTIFVSYVFKYL